LVDRSVQKLNRKYINSVVKKALDEDLRPRGDITTNLISLKNKRSKAKIIAKQNGVIAGLDFCKAAFKLTGKETNFKVRTKDGKKIKKNKVIAEIKAKTKTILIAERTALNFLNHASGIATLTNQYVNKVNKKTKICCTRKTTPNLRLLEKYAVKKGGGYNHRYNLSDEILIKDNHISAENNLKKLIKKAIKTKKVITVEIENAKQLNKVLGIKFKRILFDNMSPKQLKKCLKICKNKYETEYSGNATLKNIKKISNTGINRISVGAITHSAKSFDVSLELSS
jgi:nicotinate-nucleotide pyrophosphorylase (carboxylating)